MLPRSLLARPLARAAAAPARRTPLALAAPFAALSARTAAGKVSNKPGAENLAHAAINIKEEVGNVGDAAASAIAGHGQLKEDGSLSGDYKTITTGMIEAVPAPVMQWGLAGGIPYAATAAATAYTARSAVAASAAGHDPTAALELLHTVQSFQITYGAVMLSFLGAIHWGFEFAKYGGQQGHKRLALGVLPLAYAWPTLYLASPGTALVAQWAGFLFSWGADRWAGSQGWTPKWYSTYRFYLTSLAGGSLLFSLFALNEWDPSAPGLTAPSGRRAPVAFPGAGQGALSLPKKTLAEEVGVKVEQGGKDDGFLKMEKVQTPKEKKEEEAKERKEQEEREKKEKEEKEKAMAKQEDAAEKKQDDTKDTAGADKPKPGGNGEDDTQTAEKQSGKETAGPGKYQQGQEVDEAPGRSEKQDEKSNAKRGDGEATPKGE